MVKRAGFALVAVLASFAWVGSATADPQGHAAVSFTMDSSLCSQLAAGQVITGDGVAFFHGTPSDGFHVSINGTATDNLGNSWGFEYNDNVRPVPGGSVQISDHFNLTGNGGGLKLHSHFTIVFDQDGNPVSIKQVTGDPVGCDPI